MKKSQGKGMTSGNRLRVLDLFAGCGGLSAGLSSAAGFDIVAACEIWKPAAESYRKSHPDTILIEGDLNFENPKRLVCQPFKGKKCDLIVGGVPCQSYSLAGDRDPEDPRFWLYEQYLDVVKRLMPRMVVIENVLGILTAETPDRSKVLGKISVGLHSLGYSVGHMTANTADYGTAQTRERVLIFGCLEGEMPRLVKTHDEFGHRGLPRWRTFLDATGDLPEKPCDFVPFNPKSLRLLKMLKEGQNWQHLPQEYYQDALGALMSCDSGSTGCCRRLKWDQPSPTLLTSPVMRLTCLCHPDEHRPLSIQEYLRVQDFPDDFPLCGTVADKYRQLGNAVPLRLGKAVGLAIMKSVGMESETSNVSPVRMKPAATIDRVSGLTIHPFALLLPSMSQDEMNALAEDVRKNGLIEDIILHEGKILDGVHRLKACGMTGVKPRFRQWDGEGGTPIQFVWSKNWSRRHLTASQKAVVALAMEEEFSKQSIRGRPPKKENGGIHTTISWKARDRAADIAGVSPRYVQDAKYIAGISADLVDDVRCDRLTIPEAKKEAMKLAGKADSKSIRTHRVELDIRGQKLRSSVLTEDEALQLAESISERITTRTGVSLSVIGDDETAIVPLTRKNKRQLS